MKQGSSYIGAEELRALLKTVETLGFLDRPTAERLIREHARLSLLTNDLIWVQLGCPQHKDYRGRGPKPPTRDCTWCRSLWDFHQEHQGCRRFEDAMAEQQRRVDALFSPPAPRQPGAATTDGDERIAYIRSFEVVPANPEEAPRGFAQQRAPAQERRGAQGSRTKAGRV